MKCLEKDRSRRYETANGLARDVERYLADESVEACPPSAGYRLRKFVRRNRGPVLAASIIFLLLVGGIVGTTWGLIRADRARKAEADRAEGEKKANAQAQKRLQQIEKGSEILASVFARSRPSRGGEGRPAAAGDPRRPAGPGGRRSGRRRGRRPPRRGQSARSTGPDVPGPGPRRQGEGAVHEGPRDPPSPARPGPRGHARGHVPAGLGPQGRRRVQRSHRPATSRCGTPRCGFSGPIIGTPSPPGTTWPWRTGRPGGRARPAPCWNRSETPC